jgi:hypothetical protein
MKQDRRRAILHAASIAGGVGAALLVLAAVRGIAFPISAPSPPDGYLAARVDGYTLYAPTPAALREGVEEIEFARRSFRKNFGAEPRQVDVVLADSPAAFQSIRLGRLRRPGIAFLPFVTRRHVASAGPPDQLLALDGGALLEPVDGALRVVATGRGGARDAGLRVGDELVALNGLPAAAVDSLLRGFRTIAHGERVRLEVRRDGQPLRIDYRKGPHVADAARVHLEAAARFRAESNSLAHEVCHQLVASHATRSLRRAPAARGYGHPALPDWVDEMAATLCESPASRNRRAAYMTANLRERIPLAEFARMEHPVSVAVHARATGSPLPDTLGGGLGDHAARRGGPRAAPQHERAPFLRTGALARRVHPAARWIASVA